MTMTPRGLYRVKIIGELHGQLTETALNFRGADSNSYTTYLAELQALHDDVIANVLTPLKAFCNQEWKLKTVLSIQLNPRPGVMIETIQTGGGIQVGNSLPSFCAGLLSLRTGLTGRSNHGRLFIPGVSEDLSSLSKLEGNYLSTLQSLGSTLVTRYGTSGAANSARLGVFSRKLGITRMPGPPPYLVYDPAKLQIISQVVARPEVATQRKRKLARGQ